MIALGQTEPSLLRSSPVASQSTLLMGVLIGLLVAVVVGGVATYAVLARRQASPASVPSVPSEPVVVETPPPVVVTTASVTLPAAASVPSASVSATPSVPAPKTPAFRPVKRPAAPTSAPLIYEDRKAW
jgi:hypothetical protein